MNKFCVNCGSALSPNSKFCTGCGTPIPATSICPTCGQNWPGSSSPVASAQPVAQSFVAPAATPMTNWDIDPVAAALQASASGQAVLPNGLREPVYGAKYNAKLDCANCGARFDKETRVCSLCSSQN